MKKIKSSLFMGIIALAILIVGAYAILDALNISLDEVWQYIVSLQWFIIAILFVCGFLTYLFNEFEDKSIKNGWKNPKWNTANSWKNKWAWKDGKQLPYVKKLYNFGIDPDHKEAFAWSTTILVWTTDKEHLFQMIKFKFIFIGIIVISIPASIAWSLGKWTMSFLKEWLFKQLD